MASPLKKYNNKFSIDVVWNLASFVMAGVIFVIINAILLKVYGEDVVGVFNQVFAIYMLLAQLAVAGIHLSVQMYVPRYAKVKRHTDTILSASLITALVFSSVITGIAYLFYDQPGKWLDSPDLNEAFPYVLWGLVFFSLNKVMLAFHNGYRRMKAFATFSLIRVSAMLIVLGVFIAYVDNTNYLPSLLAFAEGLLFIILFIYTMRHYTFRIGRRMRQWIGIHFRYGMKALPGNFLLDANARVGVIMLGLFLDDERVGVYSFALTFADGVFQIPMIFRNNINPIITKARNMVGHEKVLTNLLIKNRNAFYRIISPLAIASIGLFPLGLMILQVEEYFFEYWTVYGILVGAVALVAGFLPFQMLFNQIGKPLTHSMVVLVMFVVNVVANLIFIQFFDIYGAAIGVAIAFIIQSFMISVLLRATTKYRI